MLGYNTVKSALDILDRGLVDYILFEPSNRGFYKIKSKGRGKDNFCFGHFCSCSSFSYSVLKNPPSQIMVSY